MNLIPHGSLLDTFFDDGFPSYRLMPESGKDRSSLAVDISENDKSYVLKADFPGVKKEDIGITLDNNTLTLSAEHKEESEEKDDGQVIRRERRYGKYTRSFNLGKDVDEDNIKASFDNGVLTLELPKASGKDGGSKQIPIK